jgi:hypothetical protein
MSWSPPRLGLVPSNNQLRERVRERDRSTRRKRRRLPLTFEGLEGRTLLAATIFSVNLPGDAGSGSGISGDVRYCVGQANANPNPDGSLIKFAPSLANQQITLLRGPLDLTNAVGAESVVAPTAYGIALSGNHADRVFVVESGVTANLSGLTITDGYATPRTVADPIIAGGGGVLNFGTLTISQCTISNNVANLPTQTGGGLSNYGTLHAVATTFSNNTVNGQGNAGAGVAGNTNRINVFTLGAPSATTLVDCIVSQNSADGSRLGGGGAWLDQLSTMAIINCRFTGNSANGTNGGGTSGGGGVWSDGNLTISSSSFVGNAANSPLLGGIVSGGGAIFSLSNLLVTDSTLAGNSANNDTGLGGGAIVQANGSAVLVSSTVAGNTADGSSAGAGIATLGMDFQIYDTIVVGNTLNGSASDVYGQLDARSAFNLVGTGGSGGLQGGVNGNLVGMANPGLGTIGDQGGLTQTIPLLAGSPAIDAGSASISGVSIPAFDQRGAQRGPAGLDAGTGVDIGAYEASSSYLVTSSGDDGTIGTLRSGLAWAGTSFNSRSPSGAANLVRFDTSPTGGFASSQTVALAFGPLEVPGNGSATALVQGPGANRLAITAGNASRVFTVDTAAVATLADLTITGGNDGGFGGGGINSARILTLSGVLVAANTASNPTFGAGGGIFNTGTLTVLDSTVANDSATGLGGGGIFNNAGTLSIIDSTIANNTAVNAFYGGGAILNNSGSLTLVSATVADNTINGGAQGSTPLGGGLDQILGATAALYDTIVAANSDLSTGSPVPSDIAGTANSASAYDVIGDGGSGGLINGSNHSLVGVVTPGLGPLGYNGGPTPTLPLLFGSAAFDNGSAMISGVTIPLIDQRGALRGPAGLDAGTRFDVGAYEASSSTLVTSLSDTADLGSLRAAVAWANGNTNAYAPAGTPNTIEFDNSPAAPFSRPKTIRLDLGPLQISNSKVPLVLTGPGANLLTLSGNNLTRIVEVGSGATASLSGFTFTNGTSTATGGGGIGNLGTLTLTACAVVRNSATGVLSAGGGGLANFGTLTLVNSTVANNTATGTAGGGGGIASHGTLLLFNTTVDDNTALDDATGGGGIVSFGTAILVNATLAGNTVIGATGGGLSVGSGIATLNNTIVALNLGINGALPFPDDIAGAVASTSQYNLVGTGGSGGLSDGVNHNHVGVGNPGLGTLADNGGPIQTVALLPGSPALDAGSSTLAIGPDNAVLTSDQRGAGFLRVFNGTVDIGAYEWQPATIAKVSAAWGSGGSATLLTASDGVRLLPAGRNTDLPWLNVSQIQVTFNEPVSLAAGDISVTGLSVASYGPVTVAGSGFTYTITLSQPIGAADRVTITIGNTQISGYTRRLDVLPGDVNDDGVVNSQDTVLVRNMIQGVAAGPTIFGDINGDGAIDLNDYLAVRKQLGSRLPALS